MGAKQTFEEWLSELEQHFVHLFKAKDECTDLEVEDVASMYIDNGRDCYREMYDNGLSPLDVIEEEAFAAGE